MSVMEVLSRASLTQIPPFPESPTLPGFEAAATHAGGRRPISVLAVPAVLAVLAVLVAAALCGAPAAGAAAAPTPVAAAPGKPPETHEGVLNVTLVPESAIRQPAASQRPAAPGIAAPAQGSRPRAAGRLAQSPVEGPAGARTATAAGSPGFLWWGLAAVAAALAGGRLAWRRRARRCPSCRAAMRRLAPAEAFAELDMGERTDQLVGDVRYQVWRCAACGAVDKRGVARDLSRLTASAHAAPVGSAAYLRRRAQSGLSIWSPPPTRPAPILPPRRGARPGSTRLSAASSTAEPPSPSAAPRDHDDPP
jgi:hypothetical protein